MVAGGSRNVNVPLCVCEDCLCLFILREVHVLWAGKGLQRPVEEAVEEDEAGTAGPNQQDGNEGGTQIIDHLEVGRQHPNKYIIM